MKLLTVILISILAFSGCAKTTPAETQKEIETLKHQVVDARDTAATVVTKLNTIVKQTDTVEEKVQTQSNELNDLKDKYEKLESKWYVKVGRFLDRLFWSLVIGLPLLLVGLAFAEVFSGGIIGKTAKGLFSVFPPLLALPFRFIANLFNKKNKETNLKD